MKYYNKSIDDILKELNTTLKGLTDIDASNRLKEYGENKIVEAKKTTKFRRFLNQFNDIMIIVLIVVMILTFIYASIYSNDYTDTIVIFIVVIINAVVGFLQEEKAEVTLEGLKKYEEDDCIVKRNGELMVVDTRVLVPGDIVVLNSGDKVPADARIISCTNLKVDESPLTGESITVKKDSKVLEGNLISQDQSNMIFAGTSISEGKCEAIIVKTGMKTELGSIAVSLNTPYQVKTPLQIKITELSKKITLLVFLIITLVFIYGVINNYSLIESISLCIALAVGAIPEGLPAVIAISLSIGVNNLAKKKTVVKQMNAIETLGSTNIICSDKTGTITQNKMTVKKDVVYNQDMLNYIAALCNEGIINDGIYTGDPTETCLYDYLINNNIDPIMLRKNNHRLCEIPFDSERKMSSSINIIDGKKYILTKGSVENLIRKCLYIDDGKLNKLDNKKIEEIKSISNNMANNALRVLGFAYKEITDIDEDNIVEDNLVFVGLLGIIDPPREEVKDAIKKCIDAGIRTIMITGDSIETASAIAKELNIIEDNSQSIIGVELDKYTDSELVSLVSKYNVYARVNPNHKRRIVTALQSQGKVVAMTGDGVNDAPAIKDAHVGVGMGITGTDVTKSVADIIILDDSFATIVTAVEEGRRIFNNIRNNIVYSLSSNFAEIFVVVIGLLTGNTILLPIHILFIDLVTDSIPSICLAFEKSETDIMTKKPRGIDEPLFTPFLKSCIISSAIIETTFVLLTYFLISRNHPTSVAITLSLFSMVIQEIVYACVCRNLKKPIYKQGILSNKVMNIGIILIFLVELLFFLTPLGHFIHLESISVILLIKVLVFNMIAFIIYELIKPVLTNLFKD